MLEMTIEIQLENETYTARTNGWTVIQWERKTKQKYSQVAQEGLGFEDLYLLAHIALKDSGTVVPDFDRFCKQVKNINVEIDDSNPTPGGALDTPSR